MLQPVGSAGLGALSCALFFCRLLFGSRVGSLLASFGGLTQLVVQVCQLIAKARRLFM